MSKGQKPALSFWGLVGRVAGSLFGIGMTVLAVLTVKGDIDVLNGAGEPTTDITRILVGLVYTILGLTTVAGAIAGFPAGPHDSNERSDRDIGFDDDGDADFD